MFEIKLLLNVRLRESFMFAELTYLRLTRLDMSRNRIASLPIELKNMSPTLEILRLADNPLMAPPAVVSVKVYPRHRIRLKRHSIIVLFIL